MGDALHLDNLLIHDMMTCGYLTEPGKFSQLKYSSYPSVYYLYGLRSARYNYPFLQIHDLLDLLIATTT
jgi:hypothetical protein